MTSESRPWVGHLLNRIAGEIRAQTAAVLERFGLKPPMLRALEAISGHEPLTQVQLGALVRMDRTTVVQMVDHLEALGYAIRRVHPTDRRSHALSLTDKGRSDLVRASQAARDVEAAFLSPLSTEERRQFVALLEKLWRTRPSTEE